MRAKTYQNGKGGGRQAMWEMLRRGGAHSAGELATAAGGQTGSAAGYLAGLKDAGYVTLDDAQYALVRDTGPRAPSYNATTRTVYDWNLHPPIAPSVLRNIWTKSGLSLNAFGKAIGMSENQGTRLRQMIDGTRPISPTVEQAALEFLATHK